MRYVTGDTHGDFTHFSTTVFPEQKEMAKEDLVIICGDFGGIWKQIETNDEKYWLKWLDNKPFTTLFLDGNHENFDRLNSYPIRMWNGGKVHVIRPKVLHLMRGQVFAIEAKTFFTFGGARSHDVRDGILEPGDPRIKDWNKDYSKLFRGDGVSWWKEELPTQVEMNEGFKNLQANNFKVDYILTHSPYTSVLRQMDGGLGLYEADILSDYLQDIKNRTEFHQWIFGHMHIDKMFYHERSCCLYEQIQRLL